MSTSALRPPGNPSELIDFSGSYIRFALLLLISLFYFMSVLEVDPGDTGDTFGDTFDTYLPSQPAKPPVHIQVTSCDWQVEPRFSHPTQFRQIYRQTQTRFPRTFFNFTRRQRWHLLHSVWQI